MSSPYSELTAIHAGLHPWRHIEAMMSWDRDVMMPPNGNDARAGAMAALRALIHRSRSDPRIENLIRRAQAEALGEAERANLREMARDWRDAATVPVALVEARSLAVAKCEHGWRSQRPANDWSGFLPNFEEVLRLTRREAAHLAEATGLSPYDALLDRFEPGMSSDRLDRIFGELASWLPELVARARDRQGSESTLRPHGPFPIPAQKALCRSVMELLGFDFAAGRLDESAHPFTGGVPEDVRVTTRYFEDDFLPAVAGTIHETGHARYAQGLPPAWRGQPAGAPRSFGIHESQSLAFEMQLGRSHAFMRLLAPMAVGHLGPQPAFAAENLHRLLTRVTPGPIRVDADELTYPLHIIIRYEIERALIVGDIEAADVPAIWDEKMAGLLSVDTRGNHRDGCMQDIHWAMGAYGYFPSYALGAIYAAQWFAAMRRSIPALDERIARGELEPLFDWLERNIWSQGSLHETDTLVRNASGEALDPAHYRRHLERRYLEGER